MLDYLTGEILAGRISPDERLPNERELAAQLGASRSAVREALKVLQAQGVVTSQIGRGRGTRVAVSQGHALGRMLKLHLALGGVSFAELTETRVVLERAAVEVAALHGDDETFAKLDDLLTAMSEVRDAKLFNELDTAFHVAMAEIGANNRLFRDLTIAIREAVAVHILNAEERLTHWEGLRGQLMVQHESILEALRSGDGRLAANRCEAHIRGAHQRLLERTEIKES